MTGRFIHNIIYNTFRKNLNRVKFYKNISIKIQNGVSLLNNEILYEHNLVVASVQCYM